MSLELPAPELGDVEFVLLRSIGAFVGAVVVVLLRYDPDPVVVSVWSEPPVSLLLHAASANAVPIITSSFFIAQVLLRCSLPAHFPQVSAKVISVLLCSTQ